MTIAFALPGFESLLAERAGAVGRLVVERFANRELALGLETAVEGESCALVGSVAPPDEQLLGLLLAADTLRRHGAARIAAILPYLGYARQDAPEPRRGLGIAWIGGLLGACGIDRVATIDVHSAAATERLGLPLTSLSPAELFASQLTGSALLDAVVVAPDEGAIARCRALAEAAGVERPIAYMRKERTPTGVAHREFVGEVGRRALVVDDILDTGATLVSCCRELQRIGVEQTTVVVTHGLFTGEAWKALPSLGVRSVYVSDSLPGVAARAPDGAHLVNVHSLIEAAIEDLA
jgi:ribose-phosphate pyrophosphokinase